MKIKYFKRLNTKISALAMALVLVIFIAGGTGIYFYGSQYFLKEFYGPYLDRLVSEKKTSVDAWFSSRTEVLEELAKNNQIRENPAVMGKDIPAAPQKHSRGKSRKAQRLIEEAQQKTSELLAEKVNSGAYVAMSVLSPEGKVVASYKREMEGEDWSDRDFFKKGLVQGLKAVTVSGFQKYEGPGLGVEFLAPVIDADGSLRAVIYSVSDIKDLQGFLRITKGRYQTEKVEIIDAVGDVLLTKAGAPSQKIKYNLPKNNSSGKIGQRAGLLFYIAGLDRQPFRLIYTSDRAEVISPLYAVIAAFSAVGCLIILVLVLQNIYSSRLITKPVERLTTAVRSFAINDFEVDFGKGYKGELLELKKEFEALAETFRNKESVLKEGSEFSQKNLMRAALLNNLSSEINGPISSIINDMEVVLSNEGLSETDRKALSGALGNAKNISAIIEDLLELSMIEEGKLAVLPEEFSMAELAREVEDSLRQLIGLKEIELIVDCDESLCKNPVYSDRHLVKKILVNLSVNAVRTTDVGTVTILLSEEVREGIEYLEISVADTGKGIDPQITEQAIDEFSSAPSYLWLIISKKLADALGGKLEIEKTSETGSVFTVKIPVKARIY